ncbi:hypothetical protein D3C84_662480 [compost metagenome]
MLSSMFKNKRSNCDISNSLCESDLANDFSPMETSKSLISSPSIIGGNCRWSPTIIDFFPNKTGKASSGGVALLASSIIIVSKFISVRLHALKLFS